MHRVSEISQPRDVSSNRAFADSQATLELVRSPGCTALEKRQKTEEAGGGLHTTSFAEPRSGCDRTSLYVQAVASDHEPRQSLPERPNLRHLKKQAKDLLEELLDQDDFATLSEAQRMLAQQYGFDTWHALRREVDQRAVAGAHEREDGTSGD